MAGLIIHAGLRSPLIEKAEFGAQTISQGQPAFCPSGSWSGDVSVRLLYSLSVRLVLGRVGGGQASVLPASVRLLSFTFVGFCQSSFQDNS